VQAADIDVEKKENRMASTKEVLDHHLKCFGESDLAGILSDYAADSVMLTPEGPIKGAGLQKFFEAIFAEFAKPGATFAMKQQYIEGHYAYLLWTAETADNSYEGVMDTFVIRDGKIVAHSLGGKITPKH
jgi:ketosteroid isomerase-like protein